MRSVFRSKPLFIQIKMAKGYHQSTKENPFAGGRRPIWPSEMVSNRVTITIPRVIKIPTQKIAKAYAQLKTGNLSLDEALEIIKEVMIKDLENK